MDNALQHMVGQFNEMRLLDLVKTSGGCTGFFLSMGGDERGYFGCELQIYTVKSITIVIAQRTTFTGSSPEPEFRRFLKQYASILQLRAKHEQLFQTSKRKVLFHERILS